MRSMVEELLETTCQPFQPALRARSFPRAGEELAEPPAA
jgi:hypothetical protein